MQINPIGVIHSPFKQIANMPIQPSGAKGKIGQIELDPDLTEGLADLEGFSHLIVLYHFHQATKTSLTVTPFLDADPRGVFATRAPTRPNRIGLSILKLLRIEDNILTVENIDILDGSPLLDIKPYVPKFDLPKEEIQTGWLEESPDDVQATRSDKRFS